MGERSGRNKQIWILRIWALLWPSIHHKWVRYTGQENISHRKKPIQRRRSWTTNTKYKPYGQFKYIRRRQRISERGEKGAGTGGLWQITPLFYPEWRTVGWTGEILWKRQRTCHVLYKGWSLSFACKEPRGRSRKREVGWWRLGWWPETRNPWWAKPTHRKSRLRIRIC